MSDIRYLYTLRRPNDFTDMPGWVACMDAFDGLLVLRSTPPAVLEPFLEYQTCSSWYTLVCTFPHKSTPHCIALALKAPVLCCGTTALCYQPGAPICAVPVITTHALYNVRCEHDPDFIYNPHGL